MKTILKLIVFVFLAVSTLCGQYRVTYSEPNFGGIIWTDYTTPGSLTGFQAAGCTDNVYAYTMTTYGQLGWNCFNQVSDILQEWTNHYYVAVFVQWSASSFYPARFWYFPESYAWCNGWASFSIIYLANHVWPETC